MTRLEQIQKTRHHSNKISSEWKKDSWTLLVHHTFPCSIKKGQIYQSPEWIANSRKKRESKPSPDFGCSSCKSQFDHARPTVTNPFASRRILDGSGLQMRAYFVAVSQFVKYTRTGSKCGLERECVQKSESKRGRQANQKVPP